MLGACWTKWRTGTVSQESIVGHARDIHIIRYESEPRAHSSETIPSGWLVLNE